MIDMTNQTILKTIVSFQDIINNLLNMERQIFSERDAFRFIKVETYFENYKSWNILNDVLGYQFDSKQFILKLKFKINEKEDYYARLEFLDDDIFRFRFNPNKRDFEYNSASVIQDSPAELRKVIQTHDENVKQISAKRVITCEKKENSQGPFLYIDCKKYKYTLMVVLVYLKPFKIQVKYIGPHFQGNPLSAPTTWRTAIPGIYYTPNGKEDYAIIQAIQKPAYSKYIGFGEQGGISLAKNADQLNYFNYDNMRYMQIYSKGPKDSRQPLYHSEPIFFQYNVIPGQKVANALFIANGGQVLIDLGYSHSSRYMIGTRMGDMDYFYFTGCNTSNLVYNYTSVVGRSTLKPRYVLGYHQGCYGYQRREIVQWSVDKHREYKIPLDGMHIDVDIQNKYQTFTIDTEKFPNPKEMFSNLRKKGIKCSTNITPVVSRQDENYQTFREAKSKGYFVLDRRYNHQDEASRKYHNYQGGYERMPNNPNDIQGFNSGLPYVGGVYYGNQGNIELGTSGHYPDFGRRAVRDWWGTQYKYLMECGLEFVWQDMTTPAIRDKYGDMKSFPSRILVTSSYYKKKQQEQLLTPFIKQWNLYAYNLHKATYKGLNRLQSRKNKRNFIIGRGSFTGSHRYSGLWTGDNASDWNFLKINVSQALSLGMCGVVINGQDIGGFQQDKDSEKWVNPELLIRWTVVGAFLPWFRNHYVRKGRKDFQQIFMFEHYFYQRNLPLPQPQELYRMVLPICKHYIELRYRLLQLFYDLMFENTLTGLPICRPVFFQAPDDLTLFNDKQRYLNNQFFVGKDMLIAPILWPRYYKGYDSKGQRNIYLPTPFNWYQFKNNTQPLNQSVQGGVTVRDFDASLNSDPNHINFIVPIYVKEGAIIPTIQLQQYVGELNEKGQPNPITFNIYPGNYRNKEELGDHVLEYLKENHQYKCYIDDGVSRSSASKKAHPPSEGGDELANDEYRQIHVSHVAIYDNNLKKALRRDVLIERKIDNYTPLEKYYFVAFLQSPDQQKFPVRQVKINDQRIPQKNQGNNGQKSQALWQSENNSWYYNDYLKITFVKVFDTKKQLLVAVNYQ